MSSAAVASIVSTVKNSIQVGIHLRLEKDTYCWLNTVVSNIALAAAMVCCGTYVEVKIIPSTRHNLLFIRSDDNTSCLSIPFLSPSLDKTAVVNNNNNKIPRP